MEQYTKATVDARMPFTIGKKSCPGLSLTIFRRLIEDYDFKLVAGRGCSSTCKMFTLSLVKHDLQIII